MTTWLHVSLIRERDKQSAMIVSISHVVGQDAYEMVTEEDAAFTATYQAEHSVHDQCWSLVF